ncbi:AQG_2a_G0007690.mRNA.1.CDS.1 [Saccharomyces cerevisiae]|uniref:T-complex protein 1 subunit delta n=8 Tax=Saccharomyces TaxID=4930 RepID=TCPD_YEAST|nr:chaperonin-containing T-complex subunit CCT4 [Saccharomyces cerevisiae S288C]P39078.2 RecName: Full=T-complex protein 1 subunit delta; Short=TCP-1-delta; AltName: Full=CCT-delta [Saccharomyces cerevisiae S288C]5GW4_D Chain D, T-complex protein 1 subunit delta [Saccharomyces cerevisiae S288C]5GW4_d Chain d, T-complex protein 1 subunit delta [Saccharomyces cerevisiae S288C]5GW5_D Chain D, T-complex protein 1 subunit delta [Saccharomyces cerevisiae S288C]5GW5_d Chain d, T-complex protein 1 sub|eukprot:NP_010138.1 chaperonin-containing T-complex subunit CCT4 [Saccharomyces cerevisiae S288C]
MSAKVPSNATFKNKEKPQEVRKANIIAARSVADAIRTSLGPKGMDKMIKTSRGEIIISNDGHTILKQMAILHPVARMLVEVSAAQDSEAGDGTTSVVILTGALLGAAERLLNKGIHPTIIADSFQSAAKRSVDILLEMCHKVSLSDREQLVRAASTSLSSKIVSQYSSFLAPLAVDSVLKISDENSKNVDLNDIRLVKKVGGTIDDTEMIDGVVLTQTAIKSAGGPTRKEKAKIGLIQFQISPPKPDTENNIIVNDYRQMDKILKEERAYLLNICKKIKKAKCNVLLIQKSILRDAVNDLALHFLSKLNIMVVKDIEREEIEFLSKGLGCKPIADIELFTEDRLGSADLVEEIDSDGSKIVRVTGIRNNNARPTVSVVIRGANNMIIDETERSLHDALCVIRCLVKERGLIAGGGAPEIEISRRLSKEARSMEGVQAFIWQEFASALEVIPTTLAENAGLNSIKVVTELRSKHENGELNDGISVRRSGTTNTYEEHILQPVLVSTSAITLASECVKSILRIDDIAFSR